MRSHEGSSRAGPGARRRRRSLGSRSTRLGEAGKQLAILLEDVDLDAEPELGRALTDAVSAVDRAADLVGGRDEEESSVSGRPVAGSGVGSGSNRPEDERGERPIESGGLRFAGEAGAE